MRIPTFLTQKFSGGPKKKAIIAVASLVIAVFLGTGGYFLFFRSQGGENIEQKQGEPKAEESKKEASGHGKEKPKTEESKQEASGHGKEKPKDSAKSSATSSTAVITTVSEEDDWKLETPIDTLNFNEPKDRDKAHRKVARDIKMGNKKSLAALKESSPEEKEKKAQSEAIEAWLEKGTRQDAIP